MSTIVFSLSLTSNAKRLARETSADEVDPLEIPALEDVVVSPGVRPMFGKNPSAELIDLYLPLHGAAAGTFKTQLQATDAAEQAANCFDAAHNLASALGLPVLAIRQSTREGQQDPSDQGCGHSHNPWREYSARNASLVRLMNDDGWTVDA